MKRAFTLIEILIVVVIILILTGVGAALGSWATSRGKEASTRVMLLNAQMIFDEYNRVANSGITGWSPGASAASILHSQTRNMVAFRQYYAALPREVYRGNGLIDAWGSPLHLVPAKAAYCGVAPQPYPYFVSPGPDRDIATPQDNLYSNANIP